MIEELQQILHGEIPLTKAIGIEAIEYTGQSLSLSAPLENNLNHKSTAFGGSLYSVAVLSGWGLIYLLLQERNIKAHIVIHESHTQFVHPVTSDFVSACAFDSNEQIERFLQMYERKHKARIKLRSSISCGGQTAVLFNGTYVIHH